MNITMIGTGYVGLVTGACLAEFGHRVTCMDKDEGKIGRLRNGEIPIYEPGLEALVAKNVTDGRLEFSTNLAESVTRAKAVFIAVGTPTSRRGDGYAVFEVRTPYVIVPRVGELETADDDCEA